MRPSVLRTFATGTPLFRRAGLLGDHYFGIALELRVASPAERDRALAAIDALALPLEASGGPFTKVRRVGSPWLDAWLERQTGAATVRFMPLFGLFLMTLVLIIYRSWRALGAIILTLGAAGRDRHGTGRSLRLVAHRDLDPRAADRHGHDHRHARVCSFALHRAGRFADSSRAPCARARE